MKNITKLRKEDKLVFISLGRAIEYLICFPYMNISDICDKFGVFPEELIWAKQQYLGTGYYVTIDIHPIGKQPRKAHSSRFVLDTKKADYIKSLEAEMSKSVLEAAIEMHKYFRDPNYFQKELANKNKT
jgi:hypothetical protein